MKKATGYSKDAEKAKSKALKTLEVVSHKVFQPSTQKDEEFFEFAVGRKPDGMFAVLRRCRFGHPMAVASFPVLRGEPFPTMFWLTCPHLIKACGKLESALYHKLIESEIGNNDKLMLEMKKAQEKMIELRSRLSEALDIEMEPNILKSGIAGVKKHLHVKCLHAHMAASFAGIESPVTRALYEAITSIECADDCRAGD